MEVEGVGERLATMIVMRALYWPDAFPASDPALQRAAGAASRSELRAHGRALAALAGVCRAAPLAARRGAAVTPFSARYWPPSLRTSPIATSPTI